MNSTFDGASHEEEHAAKHSSAGVPTVGLFAVQDEMQAGKDSCEHATAPEKSAARDANRIMIEGCAGCVGVTGMGSRLL